MDSPESMPALLQRAALMMDDTGPRGDIIRLLVDRVVITSPGREADGKPLMSVFYRFQKQ
jgi:hypothetical protein